MTPVMLVTHANRALGLPDEIFAMGDDLILTVLGPLMSPQVEVRKEEEEEKEFFTEIF